MAVGIYCLYFENDDEQFYIGKSTHIEGRYKKHCNMLLNGTHYNKSLSSLYRGTLPNMYIVESCEASLNHSHICGVLNGKRISHKGWRVYNE